MTVPSGRSGHEYTRRLPGSVCLHKRATVSRVRSAICTAARTLIERRARRLPGVQSELLELIHGEDVVMAVSTIDTSRTASLRVQVVVVARRRFVCVLLSMIMNGAANAHTLAHRDRRVQVPIAGRDAIVVHRTRAILDRTLAAWRVAGALSRIRLRGGRPASVGTGARSGRLHVRHRVSVRRSFLEVERVRRSANLLSHEDTLNVGNGQIEVLDFSRKIRVPAQQEDLVKQSCTDEVSVYEAKRS
jgi:hypothetical protein